MEAWKRLGKLISANMVFIVPLCIVVGVLWPQMLMSLKPIIPTLFAVVTFQNALKNDVASLAGALRRPLPVFLTVLLVHVLAPVVVRLAAGAFFGDAPDTVVGLVLEASVPVGATTVMWAGMYGGDVALALTMMFISTILAPFSIPWTLKLLCGAAVEVDVLGMMGDMLYMVGVPAILGVACNQLSQGRAKERVSPVMAPLSSILVPIIIATNSTGISQYMLNLTPQLVAIAIFVACVTATSIVFGRSVARATRQPDDVTVTMMFDCGIRNISAGAVLAASYLPAGALFPVIVGTLFQQLFAGIVGKVMLRQTDAEQE